MKKKALFFAVLFCVAATATGQWHQSNCLLGSVREFAGTGTEIIVTTSRGVFHSFDNSKTWKTLKDGIDAEKLAVNGNTIITARKHTLWRSVDAGLHWVDISGNFHPHASNAIIRTLFFHNQRLFIGLGGSDAMYHSDDLGNSWIEVTTGFPNFSWGYHTIHCPAQDDTHMYVGTSGGVYRALTWDGDCWQDYSNGLPRHLEVYPAEVKTMLNYNGRLMAGTYNGDGIYYSDDHSETWHYLGLSGKMIYSLGTNGSRIFAACNSSGLFTSDDGGSNWTSLGLTSDQPYLVNGFGTITLVNTYYSGFMISSDQGVTWAPPNTLTDGDVTAIAGFNGKVIAGTDNKRIFSSSDQGKTWTNCQVQGGWGVTAGNSILQFLAWHDTLYAATRSSGVYYSTDGAASWTFGGSGLPQGGTSYSPVYVLANKKDTLYAGTEAGLYQSSSRFHYWRKTGFLQPTYAVAVKDTVIFAGGSHGIYASSDHGKTWTIQGLESDTVYCLANLPYMFMAGTSKGVYRQDPITKEWIRVGSASVSGRVKNLISRNTTMYLTLNDEKVMLSGDIGEHWYDVSQGAFDSITGMNIMGNLVLASVMGEGVWMGNADEIGGVMPHQQPDRLSVHPNPACDRIHVGVQLDEPGELRLSLVNMSGITCYIETTLHPVPGMITLEIGCSNLQAGIYLVCVTTGTRVSSGKVVIMH